MDLNPIRAGLAKTLAQSDFTSVQRRVESQATASAALKKTAPASSSRPAANTPAERRGADRFLSPISLSLSSSGKLGPDPNNSGDRCSNKSYLTLSQDEYFALLNWTASHSTRGPVPEAVKRLGFDRATCRELVHDFGRMSCTVAARPQTVDAIRGRVNQQRFNLGRQARTLLATAE